MCSTSADRSWKARPPRSGSPPRCAPRTSASKAWRYRRMQRSEGFPNGRVLWPPPDDVRERSIVGRYLGWLEAQRGLHFVGYWDLWRWSVTDLEAFWSSVWDFFGVTAAT